MKRWLASIGLLLAATAQAFALSAGKRAAILSLPPPSLSFNFVATGIVPAAVTFTRASTAWYFGPTGLLTSAANNVGRIDYGLGGTVPLGLLIEQASTNEALCSRDLTTATCASAWVKSNTTAALTATGIDGAANDASLITATAGNGTILQSTTIASEAQCVSAYVKRVTGTGEVDMTLNGGTSWANVTAQINASTYTRVPTAGCVEATIANAVIGFRLVTNGDAVDVDVVTLEDLPFSTSPIVTTTAAVTRAADAAADAGSSFGMSATTGTVAVKWSSYKAAIASGNNAPVSLDDGTFNNVIESYVATGLTMYDYAKAANANVINAASSFTPSSNTVYTTAFSYSPSVFNYAYPNGAVDAQTPPSYPTGINELRPGNDDAAEYLGGWIQRVSYWKQALPVSKLRALTAPGGY